MLLQLIKKENGNALVFVSFAMVGLLAITGLVLDGGTLYMTKSHLQKTANAAVLSGAQELIGTDEEVTSIVERVLKEHDETESLLSIEFTLGNRVEVELEKEVPLAFSKLFGRQTAPVHVHAAAEIGTMGRAHGAAPLGIDEAIELEHYVEYLLKVDEKDVDTGNFGVLALGGPGANTYEDNLRNGYNAEIKINDILETQTGNIAGKTRSVINELVQNCPYSPGDAIERNCSRVLLVPVYKPHYISTNQLKEVKITGFAYFFITEPMSNNDTTITGMFIKRTGTGFIEPDSSYQGAYSVRLTK
ncbi:hypothetical protein BKP35_06190 [Anaerobacillus arseniciselenatis]|uniref:Putative Flp pilus-assembly TadG-like N-terminal domain-containing protein n=1 Tax=Anaerobacillus arseniciselenatis TaxID=85682 RepID=A0A1S2LSI8_9BACI|nr:Tad domain-containing protein [Anaerobacillus arseniciselenatis]OIJ14637.1 hypothetical protein BKP35_06190 [Anaerobacillus arseniciselenatis]